MALIVAYSVEYRLGLSIDFLLFPGSLESPIFSRGNIRDGQN